MVSSAKQEVHIVGIVTTASPPLVQMSFIDDPFCWRRVHAVAQEYLGIQAYRVQCLPLYARPVNVVFPRAKARESEVCLTTSGFKIAPRKRSSLHSICLMLARSLVTCPLQISVKNPRLDAKVHSKGTLQNSVGSMWTPRLQPLNRHRDGAGLLGPQNHISRQIVDDLYLQLCVSVRTVRH